MMYRDLKKYQKKIFTPTNYKSLKSSLKMKYYKPNILESLTDYIKYKGLINRIVK